MATIFETEVCSRCGGTGHHSFNGEHSRCYKCDGKNGCRAYTKRGAAAKAYYNAKFEIPASMLKVGDVFRTDYYKQITVVSIAEVETHSRFKIGDGDWQKGANQLKIEGLKLTVQLHPETIVRRLPTPEENEVAKADALKYQETLTKAGTVKKR